MFNNILIVCTANVCRSPLGEGLLKHRLGAREDIVVHSAGVAALVGARPHPIVLDQLRRAKISSMRTHRARQCDENVLRAADLVLVMEKGHLKWLSKAFPQFHGRTFLIGHWDHKREVPDPIGQPREVFDEVFEQLEQHLDEWLERIVKPGALKV